MIRTASLRSRVASVFADSAIRRAFQILQEREPEILDDQIRLTTIPAPPFEEQERGRHFTEMLKSSGFDAAPDSIGNVIAFYGDPGLQPVVVAAHLDTVFPRDEKLELRRTGRVLHLPGIADNGAGLVALLWVFRAARAAGVVFRRPVLGVATVGEEGQGDLRGIRHLFNVRPWGEGDCDFIAVDGGGLQRITTQGLGSLRFRVSMSGPGGHSWADFGRPNPIHSLASAIHGFVNFGRRPGTSFNVGVVRGGIGVNSIPKEASIDVDLRSVSAEYLGQLHSHLKHCVGAAATAAGLSFEMESIGQRPLGATPRESELVQTAMEATRMAGFDPRLDAGSTDANLPMSLGIPAIALGAGGRAGSVHTPEEWFDPTNRTPGLCRLLGTVAALAQLQGREIGDREQFRSDSR